MYSVVRHPLYLGNFFVALGPAVFYRIWWVVLLYILGFWLYYERIMFAEEEFLRKKFNAGYLKWANQTRAFFPHFKKWRPPVIPFSWRTAVKREYLTLFLIIVIFSGLELIRDFTVRKKIVFDPVWAGIFFSNSALFIIIRVARKYTKLFRVEGR